VLQKQRRLDEAAGCFRQALVIDPTLAAAGNNLAHTLVLQGKLTEAASTTSPRCRGCLSDRGHEGSLRCASGWGA